MASLTDCQITHPQIAEGNCPHCGLPIVAGSVSSLRAKRRDGGLRWDVDRMISDLEHGKDEERLTTITNLKDRLSPVSEALPILSRALRDQFERVQDVASQAAVILANRDGVVAVADCEARLRQEPDDLGALTVLLFAYAVGHPQPEVALEARRGHILRLIERMPEAPLTGSVFTSIMKETDGEHWELANSLWIRQIEAHPNDARVLGNAAGFFWHCDQRLAGNLLRRCKLLDPENPAWSRRLGNLYASSGWNQDAYARRDWGAMALAELEAALGKSRSGSDTFGVLVRLPSVALEAGDLAKAHRYAEDLLAAGPSQRNAWAPGVAIHQANIVLGTVALAEGDVDRAKFHLLAAVTPAGKSSRFFFANMGPNVSLARDLLESGEREVVVEFLRRGQRLQPECRDMLSGWIAEIERGGLFAFGPSPAI